MKFGAAEINGRGRSPPSTEDRHFIQSLPGEITIAGVFDGHAGLSTVVYTINTFPTLLTNMLKETGTDINAIQNKLKALFIQHDKNLAAKGYISYRDTGSTATVSIITATHCIIAHLGDSPACIIDPTSGQILHKIVPHLPSDPKEAARIIRCNGTISNDPGDAPRVNGLLMVSRAFGDFSMKFNDPAIPEMNKNWATDFCVSAEPDILVVPRPQRGILAIFSDGLVESETCDLRPLTEVAEMILKGIRAADGDYRRGAEITLKEHMVNSSSPYDGDDTTLILIDISLSHSKPFVEALTRRLKRKRSKKTRRIEGLKTITL